MAPKALVFDLDGTLWDSVPWYAQLVSAETGVARADLIEKLHAGVSIVALMKQYGISRSTFARRAVGAFVDLQLYAEVELTLSALREQSIPLGVFTSLPGSIATPMLEAAGISDGFGMVVHAGNCTSRKPHPRGLHLVLDALRVTPDESVIYVGDRDVDARTARNAGVLFAWATYGYERERPSFVSMELARFGQLLAL